MTMQRPGAEASLERLRADALALFARLPEPPVYRRAEDPARKAAESQLPEAEELLARALALEAVLGEHPVLQRLLEALRSHLEALCHTAAGRLELAEEAWLRARERERAAHPTRQWVDLPAAPAPVFDVGTGVSRYDPRPEPTVPVKLVCPNTGCKRVSEYGFTPAPGTRRYVCPTCQVPFLCYYGELSGLEVEVRSSSRRYFFSVEEVRGSGRAQIDFQEASGQDFPAARRDLLAFLYTEGRELKVVVNLTNGRMMWISPASSCFLATVAFGEGAPELVAFRAYRDEVLRHTPWGRAFIRGYYRWGPLAADWVGRHPRVRQGTRAVLVRVHRELMRRSCK